MQRSNCNLKKQRGAAVLLSAIMLLIGATLIAFLTGKSVLVEQQVSADQYRTLQATTAANAAMDYAVAYFDAGGGFDHDNNKTVDTIPEMTFTSVDGSQSTYGQVRFINTNTETTPITVNGKTINYTCVDTTSFKAGMIVATGYSDDRSAQRVVSQCVGTIPALGDDGPEQPLVSGGAVGLTGNANIINRYSNMTVWAGQEVDIGNSVSMATYLRDPASTGLANCVAANNCTDSQIEDLIDTDAGNNTQKVSSTRLGNGVDVVDLDPNLDNLTGDEFFRNFFTGTKKEFERMAIDAEQRYVGGNVSSTLNGKNGIIWVEGNATINSQVTIGTQDVPAIVIINGNLNYSGGPTIYGLLYVVGQLNVSGTTNVIGSSIVEGNSALVPSGQHPVVGNGTLNLVYAPSTLGSGSGSPGKGLTTLVAGSWRDW